MTRKISSLSAQNATEKKATSWGGARPNTGGVRAGAGRPRSRITIRLGDQFYSPMRGLATVAEISAHRFVMDIDGERVIFDAQSRPRQAAQSKEKRE